MRHWMEGYGWLQGSIVKCENVAQLLEFSSRTDLKNDQNIILIVASGSCDVAHDADPIVEFSIARIIQSVDGNFTFNKNPRRLHCYLESAQESKMCIELIAHEKIVILKSNIPTNISPNIQIKFSQQELGFYVDWLAARYNRPAFPTEFDRRIDKAWDKSRRRKAAAKVSSQLIGIYAQVYPDKEISADENYSVNLLALVTPNSTIAEKADIGQLIGQYEQALVTANMNITSPQILTEAQVSVATLKNYKRFNLDDLSYKTDDPIPPEIRDLH